MCLFTYFFQILIDTGIRVKNRDLVVEWTRNSLKVGLKNQPLIIDGELHSSIKKDESSWVINNGRQITITLEKVLPCKSMILWDIQ